MTTTASEHPTYHIPVLSSYDLGLFRTPGPGLGNLLFPIARAVIGAHTDGGVFVHPTMRQIKIGTFLRNEPDKRTYGSVMRRRTASQWKTWLESKLLKSVSENDVELHLKPRAIRYQGMKNYFYDLDGHHELVSNWLKSNANVQDNAIEEYDIAVHLRFGDFFTYVKGNTSPGVRLPFSWYYDAVEMAREKLGGGEKKIVLFTDGRPSEVKELLDKWGAKMDPGTNTNATATMLRLSQAKLLVASRSTFSMWSAYLGNCQCIWDREFTLDKYFPAREGLDTRL